MASSEENSILLSCLEESCLWHSCFSSFPQAKRILHFPLPALNPLSLQSSPFPLAPLRYAPGWPLRCFCCCLFYFIIAFILLHFPSRTSACGQIELKPAWSLKKDLFVLSSLPGFVWPSHNQVVIFFLNIVVDFKWWSSNVGFVLWWINANLQFCSLKRVKNFTSDFKKTHMLKRT